MEKYELKTTEIVAEIKDQFRKYIQNSNVISEDIKTKLIEELGDNFYDTRFEAFNFIDNAIGYSVSEWKKQNFQLAELWKEIAVNNAKVNNDPHKVADKVVSHFKEEFNCE